MALTLAETAAAARARQDVCAEVKALLVERQGVVLTVDDIAGLLPHGSPFLLLDRVTALEPGVSAEALKKVSAADPVLAGHFPGRMIYPGVLLVECVAQLAAVVYGTAAM